MYLWKVLSFELVIIEYLLLTTYYVFIDKNNVNFHIFIQIKPNEHIIINCYLPYLMFNVIS